MRRSNRRVKREQRISTILFSRSKMKIRNSRPSKKSVSR